MIKMITTTSEKLQLLLDSQFSANLFKLTEEQKKGLVKPAEQSLVEDLRNDDGRLTSYFNECYEFQLSTIRCPVCGEVVKQLSEEEIFLLLKHNNYSRQQAQENFEKYCRHVMPSIPWAFVTPDNLVNNLTDNSQLINCFRYFLRELYKVPTTTLSSTLAKEVEINNWLQFMELSEVVDNNDSIRYATPSVQLDTTQQIKKLNSVLINMLSVGCRQRPNFTKLIQLITASNFDQLYQILFNNLKNFLATNAATKPTKERIAYLCHTPNNLAHKIIRSAKLTNIALINGKKPDMATKQWYEELNEYFADFTLTNREDKPATIEQLEARNNTIINQAIKQRQVNNLKRLQSPVNAENNLTTRFKTLKLSFKGVPNND